MNKAIKFGSIVVLAALLGACASGVKRLDAPTTAAAPAAMAPVVSRVNVTLSNEARSLVASGNGIFNQDALRGQIERLLMARDLVKPDAGQTLDVVVTNFRVRNSFNAIMFGFMAGSDKLEGTLTIRDGAGNTLKKSMVEASYALGGLAGGQDASRMNWLYDEFAKHTAAEVSGVPAK
jgi:hypothetical protein